MSLLRANITAMAGYTYGEQPSDPSVIKLNTNENPYPPSPHIADYLRSIDVAQLRLYPDPTASGLRKTVADLHKIDPRQVMITNGGDEGIRLCATTFLSPGETLARTDPSYTLYDVIAAVQDCAVLKTPLTERWQLPGNLADSWRQAKVACLVNPHAPTGTLYHYAEVRRIAAQMEGILLVDEAYVDFVDPALDHDLTPLINEFENILLLRTLSKGFALAGMRVGYLLGAESLIEPMLTKTRDSYNIDMIAQQIADIALRDRPYANKIQHQVREERERLRQSLHSLGYRVAESQTNFLLVEDPHKESMRTTFEKLREQKILVRYFDSDLLKHTLRITVGTPVENQKLLHALSTISKAC